MSAVLLVEEPSVTTSRIVWIAKGEDEDWGTLRDASYRDRTFAPNRLCVVVTERNGRFDSTWMQARWHYYGDPTHPDQEMCNGTQAFEGFFPEYAPAWALAARDLAVQAVKDGAR